MTLGSVDRRDQQEGRLGEGGGHGDHGGGRQALQWEEELGLRDGGDVQYKPYIPG